MTWADASANIQFSSAFTSSEINSIMMMLGDAYAGSLTAAVYIGAATTNKVMYVEKSAATMPGAAIPDTNTIYLNLEAIAGIKYFNSSGNLVSEIPVLSVMHEVIHLYPLGDPLPPGVQATDALLNGANFDHMGATLTEQNNVAIELGYTDNVAPSYYAQWGAADPLRSELDAGSYTFGQTIDIVRVGDGGNNDLDLTARTTLLRDLALGFSGHDLIDTGLGADFAYGMDGDDRIDGGDGLDHLFGGEGADTLIGGADSVDTLYGENGDDTFLVFNGGTYVNGGEGIDFADFTAAAYGIIQAGAPNIIDVERIVGSEHDDWILGTDVADTLQGEAGNDTIFAFAGSGDSLSGGNGDDMLFISNSGAGIDGEDGEDTVALLGLTHGLAIEVQSAWVGIERVVGSAFSDTMTGSSSATESPQLFGGQGDDKIFGTVLDDSIFGQDGHDTLIGGAGGDDRLDGGGGNDSLVGAEESHLVGGDGDDYVQGGLGVDIIDGGDGNDTLSGGGGAGVNWLDGWGGNDTYLLGLNDHASTWWAEGDETFVLPMISGYTSGMVTYWGDGIPFAGRDLLPGVPRISSYGSSPGDTIQVGGATISTLNVTAYYSWFSSSGGYQDGYKCVVLGQTNTNWDFVLEIWETGWLDEYGEIVWKAEAQLSFATDIDQFFDDGPSYAYGLNWEDDWIDIQDSVISSAIIQDGYWSDFGITVNGLQPMGGVGAVAYYGPSAYDGSWYG